MFMIKKPLLWAVVVLLVLGGFASYSRHATREYQQPEIYQPAPSDAKTADRAPVGASKATPSTQPAAAPVTAKVPPVTSSSPVSAPKTAPAVPVPQSSAPAVRPATPKAPSVPPVSAEGWASP